MRVNVTTASEAFLSAAKQGNGNAAIRVLIDMGSGKYNDCENGGPIDPTIVTALTNSPNSLVVVFSNI
jgi:hypothetical protein